MKSLVRPYRIFLASPGDVLAERKTAGEVIDKLSRERRFRDRLAVQGYAWDQPGHSLALPTGMTPQEAIRKGLIEPRACDLVVVMLWSRMGTPLPPEYRKSDGTPYLSGTEWEYWNAMEGFHAEGRPRVWVYRGTAPPTVRLDDPDLLDKHQQWQRLQQFLALARNPDGSIAHGLNDYDDLVGFRQTLESHLRDELDRVLDEEAEPETVPSAPAKTTKPRKPVTPGVEPLPSAPTPTAPEPLPFSHLGQLGEDQYGHWLRWHYRDIAQTFRWIRPGRFMMGSPHSEPERGGNEALHEVRLSRGFWLADTACTQALWWAVLGYNPSVFQGDDQHPVENVSWDDVQDFLHHLRHEHPNTPFDLPTEAEWEYACRAGTRTPYWFGATITPDQVNYDGRYPYAGGPKGRYRERTVPVKALPANDWGLYQMHGNVWEWCADDLRDYPEGSQRAPVDDPIGPTESASRALRGGSWILGARYARSAYRLARTRDKRLHGFGFRLALRSTSPVRPEGA